MKAVLFLPDGVGIRNFVLSGFLEDLGRAADIGILARAPVAWGRRHVPAGVEWTQVAAATGGASLRLLRQTLLYAHMRWAGTVSMRHNLRRPIHGSWKARAFHGLARLGARAFAGPRRIAFLERRLLRRVCRQPDFHTYEKRFRAERPDVLLVSNQKSPAMVPAVLAARSLGIPTAVFVFSWDNLTSKGRIAVPFDRYLVWSDLMAEELRRYYPSVHADQIVVVGTPQFAPYADEELIEDRASFLRRLGADGERPLICYSTAAAATVPEEPEHVRALLEVVRDGSVPGAPQVVVRPAPTDTDASRWARLREDHPELIFAQPEWTAPDQGAWTEVLPTPDDVRFLANLTHHADVNVNIASTMTLDFALRDKPVVNVAFDVVDPPTFGLPLAEYYYTFDHYRPVLELGAVRVARTRQELAEHLTTYLANRSLEAENRRRLVALEVGVPPGEANGRIVAALQEAVA